MDDLVKRLHDSQPLQANLVALAKQPKHAVKTFGAEWAGMCAASALDEIERLRKEVEALRAALLAAKRSHYTCEDCWYSCPASGECCDDRQNEGECNCGAERHNAAIDAAMTKEPR